MFLLPALGSFASDALVIFLHYNFHDLLLPDGIWSIENTSYLPPLSIIRLFLLFPLNYHVYSGTRLKFTILYTILHTISACTVISHFFAFSILASENFSDFYVPALLPIPDLDPTGATNKGMLDDELANDSQDGYGTNSDMEAEANLDEILSEHISDDIKEYDVIWILLTLSLLSIGLHIMILLHVRSSAPTNDAMRRKFEEGTETEFGHEHYVQRGKKRLGYWVYNQYRQNDRERNVQDGISVDSSTHSDLESGLSDSTRSDNEMDPFLSHDIFRSPDSIGSRHSILDDNDIPRRRLNRRRSNSGVNLRGLVGIHRCFSTGYEDFMGEIRSRFTEAKTEWTSRLEDFTHRMRQNENVSNSKNILTAFNQDTPFRALLHMYAHEEVFRNKILDRAFSKDDSFELSFYAPQMLCFLLHNAFWMTGKLEKWILDRCKTDVHFAHRCFWFLRAWCLQGGIFIAEQDLTHSPYRKSGSCLNLDRNDVSTLVLQSQDTRSLSEPDFAKNIRDLVKEPSIKDLEKSNGIKFSPRERKALESLLSKVIECGEIAARNLEFGLQKEIDDTSLSSRESSPLGNPFIVDASQEYPTVGHYNAANTKQAHGFLPHSKSSLRLNHDGEEVRSFFLRTPDFLDSLINIADDLLLEPTSNRTPELRKRLQELEFTMLPSNSIYVPVNGCLHRVWRILASESIALSTKERVPCIIYLEVIDHSTTQRSAVDQVLRNWYTTSRPSQRLNTLLSQVDKIARKGLTKLRDDFQENQEKIFARMSIPHSTDGNVEESDSDLSAENNVSLSVKAEREGLNTYDTPPSSISSERASPNANLGQWLSPTHPRKSLLRSDSPSAYGSTQLPSLGLDVAVHEEEPDLVRIKTPRSQLVVFQEDWAEKEHRLRIKSAQGKNPQWRLLPVLIKSNDDLRQEQLASQLIRCMASILANGRIPAWLYPYDIVALSFRGGIMEAIPDTISIDSLRKNHPHFSDLKHFFLEHFGKPGSDSYENAKANFVESLAGYSIVCFLLQVKDRHNGNILLDNKGHIIHIDFGFFFLSSPGKNSGFESAPFKLTTDFIDVMDGVNSHTFNKFRELCCKTFIELRKNCFQITLLVQMLMEGNEDLDCFRRRPHDAIQGLQERFRLDLNDRACQEYVNTLIDNSISNWTTSCYDRYQRWFTGVM